MTRIIYSLIIVSISFMLNSCGDCAEIKEANIHILYKDKKELKNIKEYIGKYCLPIQCDGNDDCYRYIVTLQHLQSDKIDTVIPIPIFPNVGKENNFKLTTKIVKDSLQAFTFEQSEIYEEISSDSLMFLYQQKTEGHDKLYAYYAKKGSMYFDSSVINIYKRENLSDSLSRYTCREEKKLCIVWEPLLSAEPDIETIVDGVDNGGSVEPGDTVTPDCDTDGQMQTLLSQAAQGQNQSMLTTLRHLAFNALKCGEAWSVKNDLVKLETTKLQRFITDYGPEYKGVIAALENNDETLINEPIGRLRRIRDDVYQVSLLTADDLYSNSTETYNLPAFKIYTKRFQIIDPIGLKLNWPKQDGGYEVLDGNLRPGAPLTKEFEHDIVTLSMNSLAKDHFVRIELNIRSNTIIIDTITDKEDLAKDNDGDGFIGYLDINDRQKGMFPRLDNAEMKLHDQIDFKVINGDNLAGVRYDWFVNGVRVQGNYFKLDEVGCYTLMVRMTHEQTGLSKEISSNIHSTLPKDVLQQDLNAILRVGQYKAPSRPPSIEKDRAEAAEARIESYFASGCSDVRDQHNQKKSLNVLLTADLMGGAGKIHSITVKSISYKNNGCDKVCSFVYELEQ